MLQLLLLTLVADHDVFADGWLPDIHTIYSLTCAADHDTFVSDRLSIHTKNSLA